jgi:hypothetical protein
MKWCTPQQHLHCDNGWASAFLGPSLLFFGSLNALIYWVWRATVDEDGHYSFAVAL